MTEVDELLARLRKLPALPLDSEFKAAVQKRARLQVQRRARPAPFATLALASTVVLYLGWALHFTSGLYR